jgi:hypothetical protein
MFGHPVKSNRASIATNSGSKASINFENMPEKLIETERDELNDSIAYMRPGFICNEPLIDPKSKNLYKYSIFNSLQEHYDYVVVDSLCWSYLSSWYNYDFMIATELVQSIADPNNFVVNIYPDDNEAGVEIKRNPLFY